MNQCDGRFCDFYRGTQSFIHGRVICGCVNKTVDSNLCPKKQTKLGDW
ncbi:MAG TPA: hypothetical protein O0X50_00375 [Methanocorpusculum sp.]|nr:hypothetical protein [Methanocorpusculum sp.]